MVLQKEEVGKQPTPSALRGYIKNVVSEILEYIGEDSDRKGLLDTPERVVESWKELYSGYKEDPKDHVKLFETDSNSMVICKDLEFYSMCEHHMLPFHGKIHIGYIPQGQVIGLSKLARIADVFARRLQIQEGLTNQIAQFLSRNLSTSQSVGQISVGVVIEAKHHCMCARGVNKQHSSMVTSALISDFEEAQVRAEFLSLIK